ncbi:MAG: YqeG family HAD IIIA-type phosphatase [Pygmaiobacter massiliensis]|nr:YqeG family HAD IIIA-type phosphatase [Pygmaiobacter massiliensis]
MSLLRPDDLFATVSLITPEYLKKRGIRALVLDVDNTLTAHGSQEVSQEVLDWLESLHKAGIKLTIASNNFKKRVEPFAKKLGLSCVSFSMKPLTRGLRIARHRFGLPKSQIAMVGDQLFTDCLAANFYGITMLLVKPRHEDIQWDILLRRHLEKPFLHRYLKKGGSFHE